MLELAHDAGIEPVCMATDTGYAVAEEVGGYVVGWGHTGCNQPDSRFQRYTNGTLTCYCGSPPLLQAETAIKEYVLHSHILTLRIGRP